MGLFDWDGESVSSRSHRSSRSYPGHHRKGSDSRSSFFNLGNNSVRSVFSSGSRNLPGRSGSYYKRQPRSSFLQRMLKKLKRLLRDLVHYAKRHPIKVFMLVIMPLVTGGALTALLARFGMRLPPFIERMLGVAARAGSGGSAGLVGEAVRMVSRGGSGGGSGYSGYGSDAAFVERGRSGNLQWERRREYHGNSSDEAGGGLLDGIKNFFS
ncbi:hypothetical protein GGS23DRAFT_502778 [Durotheca rogersii]|uniref:uncharacterized protein n=1 Tax=Durotheca rogersii TaxID=419775 RepID=UPI00221EB844|nr:uncharacterized protein GGS23DRAFT_502778 [Durotheca rogersii]KAI5853666.1 hypothetical protein GGS23DRAFT_502778 [Durotheca rogersii]